MSYGTPTVGGPPTYNGYFNDGNLIPITIQIPSPELFDPGDCDAAFQAVVDALIDAGFTLAYAQKTRPSTQDCTPTP